MLDEKVKEINRKAIRKMMIGLAQTAFVTKNKKYGWVGQYTVQLKPEQKKMKVMLVVAEPDKFDEQLQVTIARMKQIDKIQEERRKKYEERKKKKYVKIKIEDD